MSSVGKRIRTSGWERPAAADLERLSQAPAANVDDVMQRLHAVDSAIRPLNEHRLCGPASTVRVPAGDNLFIHAAMDLLAPGDVLVVAGEAGLERALMGELMFHYLETKQIGGVVVDGLVRDVDYIRNQCPFAVFARGTSPNGPYKHGPGEVNYVVSCGGVPVAPGDVLLGDADGIVVVPRDDVATIATQAEGIMEKEAGIIAEIDRSQTFDRPWVAEQMARIGAVSY